MEEMFRPILGKGENYIFHEDTRNGPPIKDKRPSYENVKNKLSAQINDVKNQLENVDSENRMSEVIVNVKMSLGYSAKSFHPNVFIREIGAKEVGTKKWEGLIQTKNGEELRAGKDIFLRLKEDNLDLLEEMLNKPEEELSKAFVNDVRSLEEIYFDTNSSLLKIFSKEWTEGRVEVVLHPFGSLEGDVVTRFKELFVKYGGTPSLLKIRSYSPGPIFISAYVNKNTLEKLIKFNPVRTCHPLEFRGLPNIRLQKTSGLPMPKPPSVRFQSSIKVGIFDGGVNEDSPFVSNFVTEHNPVQTEKDINYVQHGLGVAGTILYGDLRHYSALSELPTPVVNVESYRVLPLVDEKDFDLYDVIDTIEDVVPTRHDIKVFNLSIGPWGPIEDDYISRFTYVIDELSKNGERLFVVAVGNDGDLKDDNNRIQAPSDTVNGLGVGAYTFGSNQEKVRASYSCVGNGREGSKVKPDVLDFGGNEITPFHLIGIDESSRYLSCGTSFSAPLVSRKSAELIGRCNMVDPLVAKALIVNSAVHPNGTPDKFLGYGLVPDTTDEILGCTEKQITVLYRNRILPKKYAKLAIPIVKDLNYKGRVRIQWTIAVATKPNPINTEDYTAVCLEDVFYPNNSKYLFEAPVGSKEKTKRLDVETQEEEVKRLLSQGWKRKSRHPVTFAPIKPKTEEERKVDFKWDTVLRKEATVSYKNLKDPYLVLHAMDRYISDEMSDFFNYSVVITIEYLNYNGDAYQETIKQFEMLEKAHVRNRNELIIRSK